MEGQDYLFPLQLHMKYVDMYVWNKLILITIYPG